MPPRRSGMHNDGVEGALGRQLGLSGSERFCRVARVVEGKGGGDENVTGDRGMEGSHIELLRTEF